MLSYSYPVLSHLVEAAPVLLAKAKGDTTITTSTAIHAAYIVGGFALSMAFPESTQGVSEADVFAACPCMAEICNMAGDGLRGSINWLLILKWIKTIIDTLPI